MVIAASVSHEFVINWVSISVILAGIGAIGGLLVALQERRNNAIKDQITDSVNHLSDVLLAKLETKEKVAQISERLARLEGAAGSALHEEKAT